MYDSYSAWRMSSRCNLKCDLFTCAHSIAYAGVRIAPNKSKRVNVALAFMLKNKTFCNRLIRLIALFELVEQVWEVEHFGAWARFLLVLRSV